MKDFFYQEHSIYTLSDPRDNTVRYVGISNDPDRRYQQHINGGSKTDSKEKTGWIQELARNGLLPILNIVEKVPDRRTAYAKENYWIRHFTRQGDVLLNSVSVAKRVPYKEKLRKQIEQAEREAETMERARRKYPERFA